MIHQSAGGVVVGPEGFIAITNQHGDSWSLPKGHLEDDETVEQAAQREIQEETGLKEIEFIEKLGEYERPRIGKGGVGDAPSQFKHITLFLCSTAQTDLTPEDPHNPVAKWVAVDEVTDYLTHQKDKDFFESVMHRVKEYIATASMSGIE